MAAVERESILFNQIKARQETLGSPHSDTWSIFLRWCESQTTESVFTDIAAIDYPAKERLPEVSPMIDFIADKVGAKEIGRAMITMLKPEGFISKHVDEGAYADYYERFHLVLSAEPLNKFYVESGRGQGEYAEMKTGELWWFNHKQPHWVYNGSRDARLHLIVDMVAPMFRRERIT